MNKKKSAISREPWQSWCFDVPQEFDATLFLLTEKEYALKTNLIRR